MSISGGGKSTVVQKLVELLGDAAAIHFDNYETPDTYPQDPVAALESGADFNVVKSPFVACH
jgi:uridine kinase